MEFQTVIKIISTPFQESKKNMTTLASNFRTIKSKINKMIK